MKRRLVGLIAIWLTQSISHESRSADPPAQWTGTYGRELLESVARTNSPKSYVSHYGGNDGLYEIFKHTDGDNENNCYINHFSSSVITYGNNGGAPGNFELLTIVSPHWWNSLTTNYLSVSQDLYNLLPAPEGTYSLKGDMPPGTVEEGDEPTALKWKSGIGSIGTIHVRFWEPPEELKGDVARCMMYLATIYPNGIRRYEIGGGEIWSDDVWEVFTSGYAAQLLTWHRVDPPSSYEILRNEVFCGVQGNRNPYVDFPVLAEYLWGTKRGETFTGTDIFASGQILKAFYTMTDDRINLKHPSIPDDVIWTVDGIIINQNYISPKELGVGIHTFKFSSVKLKGMVKVEIR